jgi:L-asparaginase II
LEAEQLIQVHRGKMLESVHKGHIAIVDSDGNLLYQLGNPNQKVYARSSMKPIQAIPLIETGAADFYQFEDADIALCCASHNAEKQHTNRVQSILRRIGLDVKDLQCGTHNPRWQDTYEELIKEGKPITALYNNCSGKHSGMLTTAQYMNETIEDYYKIDHPLQQRIIEAISSLAEVPKDEIDIGIDGCGVPVHGIPLYKLAYCYARMANPTRLSSNRKDAVERIVKAMIHAPEMVGGTDRFCTDFMRVADGRAFGKAGAEAVYCIGDVETGIGIAIKVEDGNGRATNPVAVEVLKQLNLLNDHQLQQLESYHYPKVKNCRQETIGQLTPVFQLEPAKRHIQ